VLAGQSPVESGAALVPLTAMMLLLSRRAGTLAQRIGPRLPLTVGPLLAAAGMVLLARVGMGASYVTDVLPGVLVWALGMALLVAPLTSAALAAAGERRAGIAAALNNEAARVAGLVGVAIVPALGGIMGTAYREPATFQHGFRVGVLACAALCAAGGIVAFVTLAGATSARRERPVAYCAVAGPPLRPCEHAEADGG
jgi:MFS family permease